MTGALAIPPILRWAGSKRRLIPQLLDSSPSEFGGYVEPFAGSAVLFFALRPSNATLGDQNRHLVSFYRQVRRSPVKVLEVACKIDRTASAYYSAREAFNRSHDSLERAGLFLFLNWSCFNGLYRENKLGHFNVPFGTRTPPIPTLDRLREAAAALKPVALLASDFEATMADAADGSFLYVDPPFFTGKAIGEYGRQSFGETDFPRLERALDEANKRGAQILLSLPRRIQLNVTTGWRQRSTDVSYKIAGNRGNGSSTEILWSNY